MKRVVHFYPSLRPAFLRPSSDKAAYIFVSSAQMKEEKKKNADVTEIKNVKNGRAVCTKRQGRNQRKLLTCDWRQFW